MSLLARAAADVRSILNDVAGGFAIPITIIPPDYAEVVINGFQTDVGLAIDPDTGVMVAGRKASIVISQADLAAADLAIPEGIPEDDENPWLVRWTPPTGGEQTMKVVSALPDKLGCLVLTVVSWREL